MRHVPNGSATEAIKPPSMEDLWYAHALQWSAAFLMVNRRFPLPKEKFSLKPSCDASYEVCLYLILSPHLPPVPSSTRKGKILPNRRPLRQQASVERARFAVEMPESPQHRFPGIVSLEFVHFYDGLTKHVNLRMRKSSTSEYFWAT